MPALQERVEKRLLAAVESDDPAMNEMASHLVKAGGKDPVEVFLAAFEPMIPAIDRFFEDVLVMAEEEGVRRNRLGLLQRIAALAAGVAEMSRLEGF